MAAEKKDNYGNDSNFRVTLLMNEYEKFMCPIGHSLSPQQPDHGGVVCFNCKTHNKEGGFCDSCFNQDQRAQKQKEKEYSYCLQCADKFANKAKEAIKKQRQAEARIMKEVRENPQISLDLLTGLMSATALTTILNDILVLSPMERANYSVLLMDLDHFKKINAQLTHQGADKLIQKIGYALQEITAADLIVNKAEKIAGMDESYQIERLWAFRQGGDEFALVIKDNDWRVISDTLYKLILSKLPNNPETNKRVTMSVGIAKVTVSVGVFKNASQWLECADRALYDAKKKRNDVRIYNARNGSIMTFNQVKSAMKRVSWDS